ncbi:MAG: sulfate adenylyltransferase subunit CysN [Parcubacteria group bacterium]|nr:sulfate adenylyltransferase subunit CysN [Parcubacteria group bacterium]
MSKQEDLDRWHLLKKQIDSRLPSDIPRFRVKEVWLCHLGKNVGHEENGSGGDFLRPILIVRKFNKNLFIGIPLSSQIKDSVFYYPLGEVRETEAAAILSQTRPVSSKRLKWKMHTLSDSEFEAAKKAARERLFGS